MSRKEELIEHFLEQLSLQAEVCYLTNQNAVKVSDSLLKIIPDNEKHLFGETVHAKRCSKITLLIEKATLISEKMHLQLTQRPFLLA